MGFARAFGVMVYRQLKRFVKARGRLVMTLAQPIIWIVFFGVGMGSVFSFSNPVAESFIKQVFGGLDYMTFLTTGVVGMTVFLGSFISGITVLWDKQFGFLKETLVAPAPRSAIILGRSFGDTLVVLLQAAIIALVAKAVAPSINLAGLPAALAYGLILGMGLASAGIVISLRMTTPESFQVVMNFVMMPLMFLSGVFYPLDRLPLWAKAIATANPLTYAVDGVRYWLTGASAYGPLKDLVILSAISAVFIALSVWEFRRATLD